MVGVMSKPRNPRASIFDHLRLRAPVIEACGPPTPAIKRLLDNARALLMPSFAERYGYPVARRSWQETPMLAADLFCGDRSILVSGMTNITVTRERRSLLWSPSSATREICSEFAIVVGMEGSHHPVPPGEMCCIIATEILMMLIVMRHADEW